MQSADMDIFEGMDMSQFSYIAGTDATPVSSSDQALGADSGALVPMSMNDKRMQLTLMGWPQGLPEPDLTRHLYVAYRPLKKLCIYSSTNSNFSS